MEDSGFCAEGVDTKKAAGHCCPAALRLGSGCFGLRGFGVLVFQGLLCLRNDGGKRGSIGDCEIREDLAVRFDTGGFEAFDEAGVSHVLGTDSGVDTLCPETAELTLALFTVAVFVLLRFADCVLGVTEELRAETAEALCPQDRPLAAAATCWGIGGSWHCILLVVNKSFFIIPSAVSPVRVSGFPGSGCVKAVRYADGAVVRRFTSY